MGLLTRQERRDGTSELFYWLIIGIMGFLLLTAIWWFLRPATIDREGQIRQGSFEVQNSKVDSILDIDNKIKALNNSESPQHAGLVRQLCADAADLNQSTLDDRPLVATIVQNRC